MTAIDETILTAWELELLASPVLEADAFGPGVAGFQAEWASVAADILCGEQLAVVPEIGLYDIDDEVIPVGGSFIGHRGVVVGLNFADPVTPFRIRFDLEGDPVAWYGADDLMPAGGAR